MGPRMKVRKKNISKDKMGLESYNWSNLNAHGTENPLSHALELLFPSIGSRAKKWLPE